MKLSLGSSKAGRHKLKYRGLVCLNCQHPLDKSDQFCSNCSQVNSTKKLTLTDFFEEFFSSLLSYDNKLFRTLAALLTRPGKITSDYIAGKRVSYTNPFRFLLSLAIIYFLLMGLGGDFEKLNRLGGTPIDEAIQLDSSLIEDVDFGDANGDKQALMKDLDSLAIGSYIADAIKKRDSTFLSNPKSEIEKTNEFSLLERHFKKQEVFRVLLKNDSITNFTDATVHYGFSNTFENRMAFNMAKSVQKVNKAPGTFVNALFSKLPFTTFFFLPVFSIFIWFIYIRKSYTYTDHLIFSFHNQSLLFILLTISYVINRIFNVESNGVFLLVFAIYLYKGMRNFYGQGRFKTIVKYIILNTVFVILATMGVILLLAGSIFTY